MYLRPTNTPRAVQAHSNPWNAHPRDLLIRIVPCIPHEHPIQDYMGSALAEPNVDGIILDDKWGPHGPSEEDKNSIADIGLSQSDVTGLTADWLTVMACLSSYASAHKKYIAPTYMGDALSLSANSSTCTAAMKTYCGPNAPSAAPHYFSVAYDKV